MTNTVRIIGLDPGLRRTGWGVVLCEGARLRHVAHGVVAPDEALPLAERLLALVVGLRGVIALHAPDEAAVEEVFVNINPASTLKLGQARAASLIAPAEAGLPVSEYAAREVKKALVGTGSAEKAQIAFMIHRILPGCGPTSPDAADALAVAVTHAHRRSYPSRRAS